MRMAVDCDGSERSSRVVLAPSHALSVSRSLALSGKFTVERIAAVFEAHCEHPSLNPRCRAWRTAQLEGKTDPARSLSKQTRPVLMAARGGSCLCAFRVKQHIARHFVSVLKIFHLAVVYFTYSIHWYTNLTLENQACHFCVLKIQILFK